MPRGSTAWCPQAWWPSVWPSCASAQDVITAERRDRLVGLPVEVLVDAVGVGRTHREAPEIDGVVLVDDALAVGEIHTLAVDDALGPDLVAREGPR